MRLTILFILLTLMYSTSFGQIPKKTDYGLPYLEYIDPNCGAGCPVLIFFHGHGERGTDLNIIYRNGTPKLLKQSGLKYLKGFTLLCPQMKTTDGNGWNGTSAKIGITFTKWAKAYYNTPNIFATGLSMGGGGAWENAYSEGLEGLITGIVPVSTTSTYPGGFVAAQRKVPVWAIHGTRDGSFTLLQGKQAINSMNIAKANPEPIWTEIIGGRHDGSTWDVAYSLTPRAELGNTTIYEWMLKNSKPVNPTPPKVKDLVDSIYTYPGDSSVYFLFKSKRVIKK